MKAEVFRKLRRELKYFAELEPYSTTEKSSTAANVVRECFVVKFRNGTQRFGHI